MWVFEMEVSSLLMVFLGEDGVNKGERYDGDDEHRHEASEYLDHRSDGRKGWEEMS